MYTQYYGETTHVDIGMVKLKQKVHVQDYLTTMVSGKALKILMLFASSFATIAEEELSKPSTTITKIGKKIEDKQFVIMKTTSLTGQKIQDIDRGTIQEDATRELALFMLINNAASNGRPDFVMPLLDYDVGKYTCQMIFAKGKCDLHTALTTTERDKDITKPPSGLSVSLIRFWFLAMCKCIRQLHQLNIAHLDVSLENFVLSDDEISTPKLIDLGLARCLPKNKIYHFNDTSSQVDAYDGCIIGKLNYIDNHNFFKLPWNGYEQDVFSLGVCLYMMVFGDLAYDDPSDPYYRMVVGGRLPCEYKNNMWLKTGDGQQLLILMRKMMIAAKHRFTIDQVLADSFFIELS